MYTPRASASTSSGWAYSRSIRSRTRRSSARSRRRCAEAGLLLTARSCHSDGPESGADVRREVLAGQRGAPRDEICGRALKDDLAAVVAGARAEVDDPVGVRHDRLVVLDDDDRLAGVDEPVEEAQQLLDVGEVQAGGRLVEDVDVALASHVRSQLEPLALAARQRGERLADGEVAEPDGREPLKDLVRRRRACLAVAEELRRLGDRHREHLADVLAAEGVLQHGGVEPLAA